MMMEDSNAFSLPDLSSEPGGQHILTRQSVDGISED